MKTFPRPSAFDLEGTLSATVLLLLALGHLAALAPLLTAGLVA